MASIKNEFRTNEQTADEEDLMANVLEKDPDEYASIFATEENAKGVNLTLEDLEAAVTVMREMLILNDDKRAKYNETRYVNTRF